MMSYLDKTCAEGVHELAKAMLEGRIPVTEHAGAMAGLNASIAARHADAAERQANALESIGITLEMLLTHTLRNG